MASKWSLLFTPNSEWLWLGTHTRYTGIPGMHSILFLNKLQEMLYVHRHVIKYNGISVYVSIFILY